MRSIDLTVKINLCVMQNLSPTKLVYHKTIINAKTNNSYSICFSKSQRSY